MTWSMNCFFVDPIRFLDWKNWFSQTLPLILLQRFTFSKTFFSRHVTLTQSSYFWNLEEQYSISKYRNWLDESFSFLHFIESDPNLLDDAPICHPTHSTIYLLILLLNILDHLFIFSFSQSNHHWSIWYRYSPVFVETTLSESVRMTDSFLMMEKKSEKERRTRRRYRQIFM